MSRVKIRTSDQLFSRCIRERASWTCERCGSQHAENSMGLHCSHFHGRGKWATRFDPDNCLSLCYGCHSYLGAHPVQHEQFYIEKNGQELFEIVNERANDTSLGRLAKKSEPEIRAHYRAELERMKALRAEGIVGRIEFEGWA